MTADVSDLDRLYELRAKRARLVELQELTKPQLQDYQQPPKGNWRLWVFLAGRGTGKTFAGMYWLNKECMTTPGLRCRIIAPTLADGVASCVEGVDGLIRQSEGKAVFRASAIGGSVVEYPNGSKVWIIGTHAPTDIDRLRALTNIDIDVFEEAFANRHLQAAVDQAELSRRRGQMRAVFTSTPRPHKLHREWAKDPEAVITHAKTSDNKKADPAWVARQERKYKGTRLYDQEILGLVLEDVEGALWTQTDLERSLYEGDRAALIESMDKIAVGVDPPRGSGTCGIVVVGRTPDKALWVLEDFSLTDVSAGRWAKQVNKAAEKYGAMVVVEVNMGGRMVTEVLKQSRIKLAVHEVNATQSKEARAEPYALRWEADEQTAFVCPPDNDLGEIVDLIDQLTTWIPKTGMASPDRLDAMIWACKWLHKGSGGASIHPASLPGGPSVGGGFGGLGAVRF